MNQLKYSTVSFNVLSENNIWGQHFDSIKLRPLLNFPFPFAIPIFNIQSKKWLLWFLSRKFLNHYILPHPLQIMKHCPYIFCCVVHLVVTFSQMLSWYILHDLHSACSFDIIAGVILSPKTLVYYHLENYHTKLYVNIQQCPANLSGFQLYQFTQSPF